MANKYLDLNYSKSQSSFFANLAELRAEIKDYKAANPITTFDESDEHEIGRGRSYALFPELRSAVALGTKVTTTSFRNALASHGVDDVDFQNKILCMILQNKSGVHFGVSTAINNLLLGNNYSLFMNNDYTLSLEVNSKNKVSLILQATWEDCSDAPAREPAISVKLNISITPDSVAVTSLDMTKISDSPETNKAFKFLEDNQQNILEKILSCIKRFLGFNSELRLEGKEDASCSTGLK